jgi:hypothetical protein
LKDIDSLKVEYWLKNGVVWPESPFKFTPFQVWKPELYTS